ncbi:MAG: glycoside hydrolase family protein [Eubacteriales bacterium]
MNKLREYEQNRLTRLPIADIADRAVFCKSLLGDESCWFWCSDMIEHDGVCHLFATRWTGSSEDWRRTSEVRHYTADSPEGTFTYRDTPLTPGHMPEIWQTCAHNPQIFHIDDKYVLIYITFDARIPDGRERMGSTMVGMLTADTPDGPWTPAHGDGIVLRKSDDPAHWTFNSCCGCSNPTLTREDDGKYRIYFKCGTSVHDIGYGCAVCDTLCGEYIPENRKVTDNIFYIEDAKAFVSDGVAYLVTTDNFGTNTGIFGALILWEKRGDMFRMSDAKLALGRLCDYTEIPDCASFADGERSTKLERPGILMRDGRPAYLTACTRTSLQGSGRSEIYLFKIQ